MQSLFKKSVFMLLTLLTLMLAQVTPASAYGAPVCASATITVTNNNDSGAGSLRQALVDVCPGETINFSEALAGQIITLISPLVIDRNVTINGQLAAEVVDIEGNAVVRVMTVNNGVTAFLDNLYIYDGSSANGGIIRNDGTLTVTNISVVSGSSSNNGGGIYNAGTLTVTNSTFSGNTAVDNGGGIHNSGTLTVTNSTFSGNTASYGGGLFNSTGNLTVRNSTFKDNGATATNGGSSVYTDPLSAVTLYNTLLVRLAPGNCYGTINANSDSLATDSSCGGAVVRTAAEINLGALTGTPAYFPLLSPSAAIDNGSDATCAASPVLNTSQNGVVRPIDGDNIYGAHCDIGSYEAPAASFTVTFNGNNSTGGSTAAQSANSATALTSNGFTRTGHTFAGWNTAANGSGTSYANGATYPFDADVILYAQWTITGPIFSDVPTNHWAFSYIGKLFASGITSGCGAGIYCPDNSVTRDQMAVFLLKGMHGASYTPPAVGASTGFGDVAATHWAAAWIKQLAAEGITSGCGGGNYCPDAAVTRAQIAIFLLKAKNGSSYSPPAVGASTGFSDVAVNYWAAPFIKQLVVDGITSGCGAGVYCPDSNVTRAEMAVLLVKAFNLP